MPNEDVINRYSNPLIVQSDRTILLDVHAPRAQECRNALIPFAELERSPEHLHTYRLTPLSLWNAASAGFSYKDAIQVLHDFSRYDVPQSVEMWIEETSERFGKITLKPGDSIEVPLENGKTVIQEYLTLEAASEKIYKEIASNPSLKKMLMQIEKPLCFSIELTERGTVKQKLLELGWPVKDEVPLTDGESLEINLRETMASGKPLNIRTYQKEAAESIVADRRPGTGFGTIVLPCGAGKTIVGMTVMSLLKTSTLVITTNITAVHQWINELLDKTNLTPDQISEYTGENKNISPVTVATYQVLTWRPDKTGPYPHFSLFRKRNWGLIIYDEVHMLPAPVFRVVAELQAVRRVGLTATLVREDGCQGHVFSLVGPKRYDVPWKELEKTGWIASAECVEVRIDLPQEKEIDYAIANQRSKHKIASTNSVKIEVTKQIIENFPQDKILVIGQYLDQLSEISKEISAPIITGKTPNAERDQLYADFKAGTIRVLVVSKVANFAIDLPDASIAIQVSGTF